MTRARPRPSTFVPSEPPPARTPAPTSAAASVVTAVLAGTVGTVVLMVGSIAVGVGIGMSTPRPVDRPPVSAVTTTGATSTTSASAAGDATTPGPTPGATTAGSAAPASVPSPAAPSRATVTGAGGVGRTVTRRPDPTSADAVVVALVVRGRGPSTGYDRALFGWNAHDFDRNGCDQRNDVLRRDLTEVRLAPGSNGCRVEAGVLQDRYTQTAMRLPREQVEIDHVVSLSNAWQHGAARWTREQRLRFANDPLNLIATSATVNRSKSDGDTATWLPPATTFRCDFVARQATVKLRYGLSVTPAERDAMVRVLAACPGRALPTGAETAPRMATTVAPSTASTTSTASAPSRAVLPTRAPTRSAAPSRPSSTPRTTVPAATPPARTPATDPRFGTCKAAKAAGYGPYRSGVDPEYDWYRDADSDGIVCE